MKFYYCPICHKRYYEIVFREIKDNAICGCGVPVVYYVQDDTQKL